MSKKANEWFEQYMKVKEEKNKFKDTLAYSTNYIDWLEKFTEEHGSFATDSFLYKPDVLSEEDKKNVALIEALYEVTDEYADDNFIESTPTDFGNFYSIQHNGVGYFIGFDGGQGASFYCTRLEEPEKDALEYKHLMSGVKLPKTVLVEHKLEALAELIERLYEEDVPVEAIHQKADSTIQKIKVKSQKF